MNNNTTTTTNTRTRTEHTRPESAEHAAMMWEIVRMESEDFPRYEVR